MAEEQDDSQKTEEPTQRRLEEARKKGQIPLSRDVSHWLMYVSALVMLMAFIPWLSNSLAGNLRGYLEHAADIRISTVSVRDVLLHAAFDIGKAIVLPVMLFLVVGVGSVLAQSGMLVSVEHLIPKLEKISPLQGFHRLFSMKGLTEFLKGIIKMTAVGVTLYVLMMPLLPGLPHFIDMPLEQLMKELLTATIRIVGGCAAVLTIVAALDLLYQHLSFLKQMRMSKQELKDEYKSSEGDPMIRGRLRQMRMERARRRMMAAVPKADVVITNPTHFAVAMKYDPDKSPAPIVVAKGQDRVALKIREIATEAGVPVVENPPLARALYATVEIDQQIPPEHYKAVAEVISYVFRLKKRVIPPQTR